MCWFFFNVTTRKFKITYLAHICDPHCISIGQHRSRLSPEHIHIFKGANQKLL